MSAPLRRELSHMVYSPTGMALWLTGLPSSGKSTLAAALLRAFERTGLLAYALESDVLRRQYDPDGDYTELGRTRFYAQVVRLAKGLADHGLIAVVDATSPLRAPREAARALIPRFAEIYVSTPLDVCRARDAKGLYAKAESGTIAQLPGAQVPYEPPLAAELTFDMSHQAPECVATRIIAWIESQRWILHNSN